jgi:hypothetical protein
MRHLYVSILVLIRYLCATKYSGALNYSLVFRRSRRSMTVTTSSDTNSPFS